MFKAENAVRIPDTKAIWRQGFLLECDGARASVQYQWRKSCIEIRMAGEVGRFAYILEAFDWALDAVLERGVLQRKEIQPYVVYDYDDKKRVYSIHSSAELTEKLRGIKHIKQLFPKVQAMAAEKVINISEGGTYNEGGDSSQFATNSEKFTQNSQVDKSVNTINPDQQKLLNTVLNTIFDQRGQLNREQVKQVIEVQDVIEAEVEIPTLEGQSRLNAAWEELKSITGAANDSIGVAKEVAANWPAITGWLTATAAALQQVG